MDHSVIPSLGGRIAALPHRSMHSAGHARIVVTMSPQSPSLRYKGVVSRLPATRATCNLLPLHPYTQESWHIPHTRLFLRCTAQCRMDSNTPATHQVWRTASQLASMMYVLSSCWSDCHPNTNHQNYQPGAYPYTPGRSMSQYGMCIYKLNEQCVVDWMP